MESKSLRPFTLAGIKKLAKSIGRDRGIPHYQALDVAAQQAGYQNIRHAQRDLRQEHSHAPVTQELLVVALPAPVPEPVAVSAPSTPTALAAPPPRGPRRPFTAAAHAEMLLDRIADTENSLAAWRDGTLTGSGYGPALASPASVAVEIQRLKRILAEDRSLLRMHQATERRQQTQADVFKDWLPHGNGQPKLDAITASDVAETEFRAAKAEMERLVQEYRAGHR
jgi:hypothetical protein